MRWVPDRTGRFAYRPYYTRTELESRCEERIERFLRAYRGTVGYPISTDELMVLIEQEVDDLDVCADLSNLGGPDAEIEGVTTFIIGRRPRVQIAYVGPSSAQHCTATSLTGAQQVDWMEWQANYACGALLMPCSAVRVIVGSLLEGCDAYGAVPIGHPIADRLIRGLQRRFFVSAAAARVRLLQLGYITDTDRLPVPARSLFDVP